MRLHVVDTQGGGSNGLIRVLDFSSKALIHSIETACLPDLAVTPDGAMLFVADTDYSNSTEKSSIRVFEGSNFSLKFQEELPNRHIYNVLPTHSGILASKNGKTCFALQTEILGGDDAIFRLVEFRINDKLSQHSKQVLPYCPTSFEMFPNSERIHMALSGRTGEACAIIDHTINSEERMVTASIPKLSVSDLRFGISGAAIHPNGRSVFIASKNNMLIVWNSCTGQISEPVTLQLPEDTKIPLQSLLVADKQLFLGISSPEAAAQGQTEQIRVYNFSEGSIFRERSIGVWPPSEKIQISPDGKSLVAMSYTRRCVSVIDIESGKLSTRFEDVGQSPVNIALTQ